MAEFPGKQVFSNEFRSMRLDETWHYVPFLDFLKFPQSDASRLRQEIYDFGRIHSKGRFFVDATRERRVPHGYGYGYWFEDPADAVLYKLTFL